MTTMINPERRHTASLGHANVIVPPAATWNGGFGGRSVRVSTTVAAPRTRSVQRSHKVARRAASVPWRGALGQSILGGLLGLAAVWTMMIAPIDQSAEVPPQPVTVSSMEVK